MKVNRNIRDVEAVQFRHRGLDLNYRCLMLSKYKKESEAKVDCEILRIDFDDIEEMVALMRMLERFIEESRIRMGLWERER